MIPRKTHHPGRKRLDDRKALYGILFVLYTGITWEFLPQELGYGSGMTCWRRLRDWHDADVWQRLHELLLAELNTALGQPLLSRQHRHSSPGMLTPIEHERLHAAPSVA